MEETLNIVEMENLRRFKLLHRRNCEGTVQVEAHGDTFIAICDECGDNNDITDYNI